MKVSFIYRNMVLLFFLIAGFLPFSSLSSGDCRFIVCNDELFDMELFKFRKLKGSVYDGEKYVFVLNKNTLKAYDKQNGNVIRKWQKVPQGLYKARNDHFICIADSLIRVYGVGNNRPTVFENLVGIKKGDGDVFVAIEKNYFFLFSGSDYCQIAGLWNKQGKNFRFLMYTLDSYVKNRSSIAVKDYGIYSLLSYADSSVLISVDTIGAVVRLCSSPDILHFSSSKSNGRYILFRKKIDGQELLSYAFDLEKKVLSVFSPGLGMEELEEDGKTKGYLGYNELNKELNLYSAPHVDARQWSTTLYTEGSELKGTFFSNYLAVLVYSPLTSGATVYCIECFSGKLLWTRETGIETVHSRYSNCSYLFVYKDRLVVVGNESSVKYIKVYNHANGQLLYERIKKI